MQNLILIKNYLRGKKTFLTGVLMISLGLLQGEPEIILEGIGLITFRAALTK